MVAKPLKKVHEDRVYGEKIVTLTDGLDFYHNKLGSSKYVKVPPSKYCPRAPRGLKEVEQPIPDHVYTKLPRMWAWEAEKEAGELDYLRMRYLREAKFFEILRDPRKRHPNVATYHGCIVKDGLIRGICMSEYKYTLQDAVDPKGMWKNKFQYGVHGRLECGRSMYQETLMRGIKHIHSLGYVHMDLKPENVMLRDDGTAAIIDFDSCVPNSTDLRITPVGRTGGWHDPNIKRASPQCDFDAIREIQEWLSDKKPSHKKYQFNR